MRDLRNVAGAAAIATIPAVAGKINYVSGIEFTGLGATGASLVTATLTGLQGGTQSYLIIVPACCVTSAVTLFPFTLQFNPPLPASGTNSAITFTVPSLGAENTNAIPNIHGISL